MNLFTGLVDRCFKECANDFTTKAVTGREVFIYCEMYLAKHVIDLSLKLD
jgi:hypothetical protein